MMEEKHATNFYTYFAACTLSLLMLSVGMVGAWSSPILFKLQDASNADNPLGRTISEDEASWIGALALLGCAIGPIPFGYIASKFGRKPALMTVGLMYLASFLILAFAETIVLYYIGRFLAGCAVGGAWALTPVYASEIAHHQDRAKLNVIGSPVALVGLLLPYAVGPYLSVMLFNLFCAFFPLVFLCLFGMFVYETPHYLISRNRHKIALEVLSKLRGADFQATEHDDIQRYIQTNHEGNLKDLFGNKVLVKCFVISMALSTFQQFSGALPLTTYTQNILEVADTSIPSEIAAIVFGVVQCVFGSVSIFVIPRFRFKTLLVCSNIGLITSLGVFGIYFYLKDHNHLDTGKFGWLAIVSMAGTVVSYMFGIGVLPSIIISEIFPTNLRALTVSIATMVGFVESFLIIKFYFSWNDTVGIAGTSWIFAACCALGVVYVYVFVPETNGKTFQEIQDSLRN